MTADEIIKTLEMCMNDKKCFENNCPFIDSEDCVAEVNTATIKLLRELQEENKQLKESQWVSVEDRLPEVDKRYGEIDVLVCMDDEFIATATFVEGEGFELWDESGEVIAWQHLPEPPRKEE